MTFIAPAAGCAAALLAAAAAAQQTPPTLAPVAPAASAAAPAARPASASSAPVPATAHEMRLWDRQHRASRIIGTDVRNAQGEKIGDIKDLVLDAQGRATVAIVSTGGFLGIGDRLHAVPWDSLQRFIGDDRLLDIDRARLRHAPALDARTLLLLDDERWLAENRRHYP
jgi:sporulation protein YlmC with PRC-barrel domain